MSERDESRAASTPPTAATIGGLGGESPRARAGVVLTDTELRMLEQSERCAACGHLDALHNQHCCEFCMVPGCKCEWGKLDPSAPSGTR